ncbi:hypothetical protein N431DRAFT_222883 [Stipitochalara longipes BDJ]|nr:hypothetical protein N431DRAFT_222883 [Stipitochalara longipes BDJ]
MGSRDVLVTDGRSQCSRGCDGAEDWSEDGEARGSMRDQQRATAFIWEFGLHIGQRSMQEAAMQLWIVDAVDALDAVQQQGQSEQRGSSSAGDWECGYALSFVPSPSPSTSSISQPPSHLVRSSPFQAMPMPCQCPPMPSPSALCPHRLRKADLLPAALLLRACAASDSE